MCKVGRDMPQRPWSCQSEIGKVFSPQSILENIEQVLEGGDRKACGNYFFLFIKKCQQLAFPYMSQNMQYLFHIKFQCHLLNFEIANNKIGKKYELLCKAL